MYTCVYTYIHTHHILRYLLVFTHCIHTYSINIGSDIYYLSNTTGGYPKHLKQYIKRVISRGGREKDIHTDMCPCNIDLSR